MLYKKNTSVLALTDIRREDNAKFEQFINNVRLQYNDNVTERRKWGGGIVGPKSLAVIKKRERAAAKELKTKL